MLEKSLRGYCCSKCDELVQISKTELEDKLKLGITKYGFAPWVNWESERTGFGKLIRRMAFYPSFLPLFVSSDHYVDNLIEPLIKKGYKIKIFDVDYYLCWGTPNDYKTYNYWLEYFTKL